ncbi:PmoA family protein [Saccharothrix sp. AJ9571]|nr:PmoA family protein [Saccharothrix sp. AJ9571]
MKLAEGDGVFTVSEGDVELLRYTYRPDIDAFECPSPSFHPLRTLDGDVVTGNRPHDHRWHKGLAMTASHLDDQNFWGGVTYVRDRGYEVLPNVGSQVHRNFVELAPDGVVEEIDWLTSGGQKWIEERRTMVFTAEPDAWTLDFTSDLRNVRDTPLEFGSPTVHGRELAGYCGFFWRGPRSFEHGEVLASDDQSGPELMGRKASWLAYIGTHDEVDHTSTLLFTPAPDHPEVHWFVRNSPYAVVNPSLAFYDPLHLAPGDTLHLRYRLLIGNGSWSRSRLTTRATSHTW